MDCENAPKNDFRFSMGKVSTTVRKIKIGAVWQRTRLSETNPLGEDAKTENELRITMSKQDQKNLEKKEYESLCFAALERRTIRDVQSRFIAKRKD